MIKRLSWYAGLTALLAAVTLGAQAQPLTGGLLGRSAGGSTVPAACITAGMVPFLGSPVSGGYTCDAGLTYDAGTDTLTTGRILVGDGSAAAPSVVFASEPTLGFYRSQSGTLAVAVGSGVFGAHLHASGLLIGGKLLSLGGASGVYGNLTAPAADTIQVGLEPSNDPYVATLIVGESGSGTNIAGANGVIQSGAGTGAGAGSTLFLKTPVSHGSDAVAQTQKMRMAMSQYGITVDAVPLLGPVTSDQIDLGLGSNVWRNLYVTRGTLGSKSKALTDATPTAFATIALADGGETGGKLIYRVVATDGGTARQVVSGSLNYSAVHVGATYAVDYDEVQQSTAVSSGTLTGTVTAAAASDLLTFSANFDTSLGTPVLTIHYRFDSTNAADVIAPL